MDAMIPEGLQYQSISQIVSRIKSAGLNVIRLTWAVEMVDQILEGGADVSVKTSVIKALGKTEGVRIWGDIINRNSGLEEGVTRLQVRCFSATVLNMCSIWNRSSMLSPPNARNKVS